MLYLQYVILYHTIQYSTLVCYINIVYIYIYIDIYIYYSTSVHAAGARVGGDGDDALYVLDYALKNIYIYIHTYIHVFIYYNIYIYVYIYTYILINTIIMLHHSMLEVDDAVQLPDPRGQVLVRRLFCHS